MNRVDDGLAIASERSRRTNGARQKAGGSGGLSAAMATRRAPDAERECLASKTKEAVDPSQKFELLDRRWAGLSDEDLARPECPLRTESAYFRFFARNSMVRLHARSAACASYFSMSSLRWSAVSLAKACLAL
jgi:hypothetical protein